MNICAKVLFGEKTWTLAPFASEPFHTSTTLLPAPFAPMTNQAPDWMASAHFSTLGVARRTGKNLCALLPLRVKTSTLAPFLSEAL